MKYRLGIFNQEGRLSQNEETGIEENDKGRYVIAYVCVVEQKRGPCCHETQVQREAEFECVLQGEEMNNVKRYCNR